MPFSAFGAFNAFSAFCAFCACEIFCKKNKKFKTAPITSFILILRTARYLFLHYSALFLCTFSVFHCDHFYFFMLYFFSNTPFPCCTILCSKLFMLHYFLFCTLFMCCTISGCTFIH